jgi:hypothetical protein
MANDGNRPECGETAMVCSWILLGAIFATLGVALAGCAPDPTPLSRGYYGDAYEHVYYCGDVGAWDIGAWGGRRNCVGPIYQRVR